MSLHNILIQNHNDLFCHSLNADEIDVTTLATNTIVTNNLSVNDQFRLEGTCTTTEDGTFNFEAVSTTNYQDGSNLNINGNVTFGETADVTFFSEEQFNIEVCYVVGVNQQPAFQQIEITCTRIGQMVIAKIPPFQMIAGAPNVGVGHFHLLIENIRDIFKPTTTSITQCATINDGLPSTGFMYAYVGAGGPRFQLYNTYPAQAGNAYFAGTNGLIQGLGTVAGTLGDGGGNTYITYTVA